MKSDIKYGPHKHQEADRRVISQSLTAFKGAQTWTFKEFGHLGQEQYRIDVRVDHSYPTQGYAKVSLWGVGGWNEFVSRFGNDLPQYFEGVNRFQQDGTNEMFELVAEDLLRTAAKLKFGR